MSNGAPAGIRRRLTWVLFSGVSIGRTGYIAAVTVTTLVAEDMLGSATFAGLPGAIAVLGTALGGHRLSALMDRIGRRRGLVAGYAAMSAGAGGAAAATALGSFPLLVAALAVFGFGSSADSLSRYAAADVLLLSERSTVVDMSLPSKLTSYFAAGRPIVAAVTTDGASAQELKRAGAGVTTPAGDGASLLHAIMWVRDQADRGRSFGDAGRRYAQTTLVEGATFDRADAIIDRLLDSTRARRRMETNG